MRRVSELGIVYANSNNRERSMHFFFRHASAITSTRRNDARLQQLFLLEKPEILRRIDIEDLENDNKEARKWQPVRSGRQMQKRLSSASHRSCALRE